MKYYHEANKEIRSKLRDSIVNDSIPFYFDRFEKIVSENGGYFVNGKVCTLLLRMYIDIIYFNHPESLIISIYYSTLYYFISSYL